MHTNDTRENVSRQERQDARPTQLSERQGLDDRPPARLAAEAPTTQGLDDAPPHPNTAAEAPTTTMHEGLARQDLWPRRGALHRLRTSFAT